MKIDWQNVLILEHQFAMLIQHQRENGVKVNVTLAKKHIEALLKELQKTEKEFEELLGYVVESQEPFKNLFKKDGEPYKYLEIWCERNDVDIGTISGPFSRIEIKPLKLTQRIKLCERLIELGWEPIWYTEKGSPQLTKQGETCPNLKKIGTIGEKLGHYYVLQHRRGLIQGILDNVREDGRVPADMDTVGTNTYRVAHRVVANIPKAEEDVFFGKECREIFTCEENCYLLGFDASGLEARVMGHYTWKFDEGEFARLLLEGDIHTYTQEQLGLETRNLSKSLRYALTYGAQPGKVQQLLGCNRKKADQIFKDFWEVTPGLARLRDTVIRYYNMHNCLPGLDGGIVRPRSEHSALNTLFQSAGAKIIKKAQLLFNQKLIDNNIWYKLLISYHDEAQGEILKKDTKFFLSEIPDGLRTATPIEAKGKTFYPWHKAGELALDSLQESGEYFNMKVPITGEYKIGRNWAETH